MNRQLSTFLEEVTADPNRRDLPGLIGISLKGEAQHGHALAWHGSGRLLIHETRNTAL